MGLVAAVDLPRIIVVAFVFGRRRLSQQAGPAAQSAAKPLEAPVRRASSPCGASGSSSASAAVARRNEANDPVRERERERNIGSSSWELVQNDQRGILQLFSHTKTILKESILKWIYDFLVLLIRC